MKFHRPIYKEVVLYLSDPPFFFGGGSGFKTSLSHDCHRIAGNFHEVQICAIFMNQDQKIRTVK